MKLIPIHTLGIDSIQRIDQEIPRTIGIGIIPTIGIEATQIIEIKDIKTIDHEIIPTTDQIIKDLITTTIKLDHAINHKLEIRTKTIDKETTLNHPIGIKQVIQILKTNIEVTHQNIKTNKSSTNN